MIVQSFDVNADTTTNTTDESNDASILFRVSFAEHDGLTILLVLYSMIKINGSIPRDRDMMETKKVEKKCLLLSVNIRYSHLLSPDEKK